MANKSLEELLTGKKTNSLADNLKATPPTQTAPGLQKALLGGGALTSPENAPPPISSAFNTEFVNPQQPDNLPPEAVKLLQENLEILRNSFGNNKEMVGSALANLVNHIKKYDFLAGLLAPEDMGLMVAALRDNYGVVIQKKEGRANKRASSKKEVDDLAAELGEEFAGLIG